MKWASAFLLLAWASVPSRAASVTVDILYVEQQNRTAPVLSRLVSPPEDEGLAGVLLGIQGVATSHVFRRRLSVVDSATFLPQTLVTSSHTVNTGLGVVYLAVLLLGVTISHVCR